MAHYTEEQMQRMIDDVFDNRFVAVDISMLSRIVHGWQDKNFSKPEKPMTELDGAAVVAEEAGEVVRAALKARFGIRPETRGSLEEELPDVILAALALAHRSGIDINRALKARFARLLTLDFTKDPEGGVEAATTREGLK